MRACRFFRENGGEQEGREYPETEYEVDGNLITVTAWKSVGDFTPFSDKELMRKIVELDGDARVEYHVYEKPKAQQRKAETDEEFESRFQEEVDSVEPVILDPVEISFEKAKQTLDDITYLNYTVFKSDVERNVFECVKFGTCPLYEKCHGVPVMTTKV